MNREFKFRAWDKKEKRFIRASEVLNQTIPVFPTKNGFKLISKFVLSQFTGKRDRQGKEIYEGDYDEAGNVVEFSFGSFNLAGDRPLHSNILIVGNIYENPKPKENGK